MMDIEKLANPDQASQPGLVQEESIVLAEEVLVSERIEQLLAAAIQTQIPPDFLAKMVAKLQSFDPSKLAPLLVAIQETSALTAQLRDSLLSLVATATKQNAALLLIAARVEAGTPTGLTAAVSAVLA